MREITACFATPDNWRVVRHPDFQLVDEVRIRICERWKESELSGDEWRFSYIVECLHKGLVVAARTFGSRPEWAVLGAGSVLMEANDNGVTNEIFELEKIVCAQPGCREHANVYYRVKALYDRSGNKEELPCEYDPRGTVHVIRFCYRHRTRGDCGLQDSDSNYEEISLPFMDK
jgi:hypothetical protein